MRSFINKAFKLINRRIPILIQTPRARSFGNCAEEISYGLLKARRENKKILFLYSPNLISKRMVANQNLLRLNDDFRFQNKAVSFLGGWIIVSLLIIVRVSLPLLRHIGPQNAERLLGFNFRESAIFSFYYRSPRIGRSTLWQREGTSCFSWETVKELNWARQYQDYIPPHLNETDLRNSDQLRTQMGIPLSDWFVCLHVREAGYHNDRENRNASIGNYVEAIQAITRAGGWVVRIGDSSMVPLDSMERVIDYPHTRFKSELMDIYLISQCRFYVGTNSGPTDVAALFKKPTILVNASDWGNCFPIKMGDLFIPKHVFSRPLNRYMSIEDMLEESYMSYGSKSVPDDYVMVENTPQEIRDVIEEYLAKPENFNYSDLQKAFNEARLNQFHRMLDQNDDFTTTGKYRFASRADAAAGTLGQKYLEKNWSYDNLQLELAEQTEANSN